MHGIDFIHDTVAGLVGKGFEGGFARGSLQFQDRISKICVKVLTGPDRIFLGGEHAVVDRRFELESSRHPLA
jgi:hypothetical protein